MLRRVVMMAACIGACGCTSTKVLQNNSVAQKFAAFNKSGWSVTGGQVANSQGLVPVPGGNGVIYRKASANPFANAVWNTNFKVDGPNGQQVVVPNGGDPVNLSAPIPAGVFNLNAANPVTTPTGPVRLR